MVTDSGDYACDDACYGVCMPRPPCADSDGIDPSTAGFVTTVDAEGNEVVTHDTCSDDNTEVIEMLCYDVFVGVDAREAGTFRIGGKVTTTE